MAFPPPGELEYGPAHDYTNEYHTLGGVRPPMMVEGGYGPEDHGGPPVVEDYVNGSHSQLHMGNSGMYQELRSVMMDGGDRFGVSTIMADTQEELVWVGNQGGHVTSYYGSQMQKYTSFQVHPTNPIRDISTFPGGVLSLYSNGLRCNARQGMRVFDCKSDDFQNMQSMLVLSDTRLLLGGHQDRLVEVDLGSGVQTVTHPTDKVGVAIMRPDQRFICCGEPTGHVQLRDPATMKIEHTLEAHRGALSDFDVIGNQLITCGFGERLGTLSVDRFLMVFDLRTMRPMAPLHVPIEPIFLRCMATYSNRIIILDQSGQFQILDPGGLVTPDMMLLYQVNIAGDMVMDFDVSSNSSCLVFGDSGGCCHLWSSSNEEVTFNNFSTETEFAEPVVPMHPIPFSDDLAYFSTIPMPYCEEEPLLSDWPADLCRVNMRQPPPIDSEILRSMKLVQFIGYAPNTGGRRRNQVAYKDVTGGSKKTGKDIVPESPSGRSEDPLMFMVPKPYRKVEIKYSKLGIDDFDFRHYNRTNFAGLEPHIPNAYCNSMLQVLYFVEPLRCALETHTCCKEFCLACEMSFLFYMFDLSKGQTCQASNFLRAFRTIPEVSALELLLADAEESTGKANFPRLIQSWNRFVLAQILQETSDPATDEDDEEETEVKKEKPLAHLGERVSRLFEAKVDNTNACKVCSKETVREASTMVVTLTYPEAIAAAAQGKEVKEQSFVSVLQCSMNIEQSTQAWCDDCQRYQPSMQIRSYKRLPDVITINCNLETQSDENFWRKQEQLCGVNYDHQKETAQSQVKACRYGLNCTRADCRFRHDTPSADRAEVEMTSWLPLYIKVRLSQDRKVEIKELKPEGDRVDDIDDDGYVTYYLHASVGHIRDPRSGGNLVAHINVGKTYHKRKEGVTHMQWYIFNDFSIQPIDKFDATQFNLDWKVPCVLYYMRNDATSHYDITITNPIIDSCLQPSGISKASGFKPHMTFTPLAQDEVIGEGFLVGLDAEFVSLNQEEAEIRSDGTRSTIKPSQMSVARITCVRGKGDLEGEPFIDDYISTQEQVVDYLTRFSGIKPGDLDATISSKHLTTLKATYLKLRYLLDMGAIFVGHGLRKDFRVINLLVDHRQIVDTAALYNLPKQRIVSLKFLAWYFLGTTIQSETHDSIEDAYTALRLYKKYLNLREEMEGEKEWEAELKKMYEEGRKNKWKVPGME
ncbi:PAN2-PAN3 deadenylation complex catalytic subunit PAN2-like isoform X1 [Lytechinus variegatus]|uniref:PAN2-PAN3 deadenylation complex catalytic subunit PAN2-like isoform X1 n=1 Tax=Lytechinus variegatus TaxID=7654 RepID=UPI001BB1906D|nr:PAN2-PAN3 deadenylation complex catalytic subunit PAN2-like isoform X1 [Lytechinus variegatus]